MTKTEALTIVIDVATKRAPHTRQQLKDAVAVLETAKVATKRTPITKAE